MNPLTPYEHKLVQMHEAVLGHERLSIFEAADDGIADLDVDAGPTLAGIAELYRMELAPHFRDSFVRFNRLWSRWRFETDRVRLNGEFRIGNLPVALATPPPPFSVNGTPPEMRRLHAELRVIDDRPDSGTGHQAAIRIQAGASDPELWYFHLGLGTIRMDIDYREYLDALVLTKGTAGWQFLYCDLTKDLRESYDVRTANRNLTTMLDVFPELFPGHDYSGLRDRLAARL